MIGNSNNLLRLQKHFKKMFAGVHALIINEEDPMLIEGVQSKEGEQVKFFTQISIKQHPNINDWLTRVEKEISLTLAKLLAQSIPQLLNIQKNANDVEGFINWLDQYQVGLTARLPRRLHRFATGATGRSGFSSLLVGEHRTLARSSEERRSAIGTSANRSNARHAGRSRARRSTDGATTQTRASRTHLSIPCASQIDMRSRRA